MRIYAILSQVMAEPILVKLVHSKATCCLFVKDSSQQLTPVLLKHSDVGFGIWKRTWHLTLGLPSSAAIWVILFPDITNLSQAETWNDITIHY